MQNQGIYNALKLGTSPTKGLDKARICLQNMAFLVAFNVGFIVNALALKNFLCITAISQQSKRFETILIIESWIHPVTRYPLFVILLAILNLQT